MSISKERNMFVAIERFMSEVVDEHGKHPVSTEAVLGIRHKPVNS
jgi:hypothetical protein